MREVRGSQRKLEEVIFMPKALHSSWLSGRAAGIPGGWAAEVVEVFIFPDRRAEHSRIHTDTKWLWGK